MPALRPMVGKKRKVPDDVAVAAAGGAGDEDEEEAFDDEAKLLGDPRRRGMARPGHGGGLVTLDGVRLARFLKVLVVVSNCTATPAPPVP